MPAAIGQYWQLTKPRVVALIVFTAVIGMLLANLDARLPTGFASLGALLRMVFAGEGAPAQLLAPPAAGLYLHMVLGALGIWLAAASAAAINHLLDQRIDALMARTAHRPLPTGSLRPLQVLVFAVVLGAASMTLLVVFVNVLCAALTF